MSENPILYILMPNDIPSMNPGKKMAQSAHAANLCAKKCQIMENEELKKEFFLWESESHSDSGFQAFGTTIVLQLPHSEIIGMILFAKSLGKLADIVVDGSYPVNDGSHRHVVSMETCGFIFIEGVKNGVSSCPVKNRLVFYDLHD